MAPITDDIVNDLKSTIHKLESRVHELEARFNGSPGGGSGGANPLNAMRMVLMGPPGAGGCQMPSSLAGNQQI